MEDIKKIEKKEKIEFMMKLSIILPILLIFAFLLEDPKLAQKKDRQIDMNPVIEETQELSVQIENISECSSKEQEYYINLLYSLIENNVEYIQHGYINDQYASDTILFQYNKDTKQWRVEIEDTNSICSQVN